MQPSRIFSLLIPLLLSLSFGCGLGEEASGQGILEGIMVMGPVCPAIGPGMEEACQPVPVANQAIIVNGKTAATTDEAGKFVIALSPGTYIVDSEFSLSMFSKDLPATIKIESGEIVKLEIVVDTGVR